MTDEELRQITKENKKILDDIDKRMHRIEKKFIYNTIFGFIKTAIILAPIIIGIIYITPFLRDFFRIYEPVFNNLPNIIQNIGDNSIIGGAGSSENELLIESFCNPDTRQTMIDEICK